MRENQGYIITDSIHIGEVDFVIGELPIATAPSPFVTWECRNGNDYFWGHYFSDGMAAKRDLLERAGQELDYQERMRNKPTREKEHER